MSQFRILLLMLLCASVFSKSTRAQDAAVPPEESKAVKVEPDSETASDSIGSTALTATGDTPELSASEEIDAQFGVIVQYMALVLFWEPVPSIPIPLIVLILLFGSIFFTVYHGWLNVRGFKHAIDVTRGKFDNPNDPGEITHFQALTSALSATVGLGNIAGVAVAIKTGGPGAVIWMMIIGLFGMTAKFHECTLAQVYRKIKPDGTVHGGPMYYLEIGLQERGLPWGVAKGFAIVFALFCIGGSFGGGNMFQANQATSAVEGMLGNFGGAKWVIGGVLSFFVGLVIIGGIKRIGQVTEKVIPLMCGIYVLAGVVILATHAAQIPDALVLIFRSCVTPEAAVGGFVGVLVQGIKRAVFSNEAGVGSAAIAHAAAKTDEPVREGVVAMLGPFIDTVVICTMTALVVIVSGAYAEPAAGEGVEMTRWAFAHTLSWFPIILNVSVLLFAYSTMISWSYYGEKAWQYIFGQSPTAAMSYRVLFLLFVILGAVSSLQNVIDFSDLMILSMAFPNVIGGIILAPRVKALLQDYWARYKNNEFKTYS
ncbi:MAG: alanine/glycine:cation symporter family protein [Planctomycetaceae bacterium]|jgi:AGCS family alanine or glycine:cation symporter